MLLTKTQIKRIEKAKKLDKGVDIKFSRTQLRYNMNKEGELFSLLALAMPALATAGKAAALGATGAAAGMAVKKALGDGLFLKRGGCLCSVEKQGDGIFLRSSHGRGLEKQRDGLYLYQQR